MTVKILKFMFSVAVLIFNTSIAFAGVDENNATANETAIESFIQDLADQNVSVKMNAVKALVEIDEPAVEPLIQALEDSNPEIRENAAHALGRMGDEKAVDPLIELLADEQWEVQKAARDALVNIGEPAVEPLVKVMNDQNKSYTPRENAILALGEIGEPAVEPLIQMLDSKFACMAAYSLRVIGEPAVEPLIRALEDDNPQVRARAAEALSGIKDERAVEPLTKALNDEYELVRTFAKMGLEKIENQKQPGVIATYGRERRELEFYIEDKKREWIEKLGGIIHGVRDDMSLYFYPEGPVTAYGYDYRGYIAVSFSEGSDINESLMDEIYEVFDQQGRQVELNDVPVVFQFDSLPITGEGPAEEPATLYEEIPSAPKIPGFTAITLLMAFLGVFLRKQK